MTPCGTLLDPGSAVLQRATPHEELLAPLVTVPQQRQKGSAGFTVRAIALPVLAMKLCWRQEWWSSSEAVSAQPWRRHLLDLISCSHNHRVPEHERKHKCERPEQKNFGRVLGAPRREQPSTWARGDGEGEGWLVSRGCWETPHIRQKCLGLEPWPSRLQPAPGPRRRFWAQGGGGIEDDTPQTVMGRLFPRLCHGKKRSQAGFQKR